ncbi:acetyl-coenzyme A synthetase 2, partial [Marasmius sp. AFHP31]
MLSICRQQRLRTLAPNGKERGGRVDRVVGPDGEAYEDAYTQFRGDTSDVDEWWAKIPRLHWSLPFRIVQHGTFEEGNVTWILESQLNTSYNCLDHWAFKHPKRNNHHLRSGRTEPTPYTVYGPLANGVTTTVFETAPVHPTPARYWETVQKHKLTQFYSAPTATRLLRHLGYQHVKNHDLTSLRILESIGEMINPEAWNWYNEHVGKKKCSIVDTFWQTETGSIVITPFPGAIPTTPGSATVPFFGHFPVLMDATSGKEVALVGGGA